MDRMIKSALSLALMTAVIVVGTSRAWGLIRLYDGDYGQLLLTGFAMVQADVHTAQPNPNNNIICGGNLATGRAACVPSGLNNANLQLFRQWVLTDSLWQNALGIRNLKFYTRTRVWFDTTAAADGNQKQYDAFPSRYRRDGWYAQAAGDIAAFQLWEAWADYKTGPFWFRVGRQNIVWGDVAPVRLLDDINPVDVSWHLVLEPLGRDVFDHLRIPVWSARGAYTLPFSLGDFLEPGSHVEGYIQPPFAFTATQLPDTGDVGAPTNGVFPIERYPSPLNVVPAFLRISRDASDGMQGVGAGGRLVATALDGSLNYTLNFLSRRNVEGLTKADGAGFLVDENGLSDVGGIVFLKNAHPRFQTFGLSMNYFESWSKTVGVLEAVWDFKRPFNNNTAPPFASNETAEQIVRRHNWSYVIQLTRPGFYIRKDRTAFAQIAFQQVIRERGRGAISSAGARLKPTTEIFTLLFGQTFSRPDRSADDFLVNAAFLADLDNSFAMNILFRYEPGAHWRFSIWYNSFFGDECDTGDEPGRCGTHGFTNANPGGWGSQEWQQGINFSAAYQY